MEIKTPKCQPQGLTACRESAQNMLQGRIEGHKKNVEKASSIGGRYRLEQNIPRNG